MAAASPVVGEATRRTVRRGHADCAVGHPADRAEPQEQRAARAAGAGPAPVPAPGTGHPVAPSVGSLTWPLLVGVLLAIAAVFILAILARRRRHQDRARTPRRAPGVTPLAEGLAAGQDALLAGGAPRAAIIACYAALERGFAAAGSAPAVADTPAEVLTRASDAGLVRSGAAEVLTGLFRRARYSSQPMTSADSEAAASALARMRADLDGIGPGSGR
jgi:Domain of unknown function (DUF4129)